jgi:site-specific recombinase XerD
MKTMNIQNVFPQLLEAFFTDRLMRQRQASPHTIASYRDTFRLLLKFAHERLKKPPSKLILAELDTPLIGAFLDQLEKERGNKARSRNVRLAAIRSFFRYVALHEPSHSALAQRVLAMPNKRHKKKQIEFLTRPEIDALLAAPDPHTWTGRRDRTMLLVAVQTGLRVSELTTLCCGDVTLTPAAHVRCVGKGRKERCTPLRKETATTLRTWLREHKGPASAPLFPNIRGGHMSTDSVERRLEKHLAVARQESLSLRKKHVTPHVLRHTTAMELLQGGVDRAVIALWLGHESVDTTQMYLHANLELKEKAMAKTAPINIPPGRYRPNDELLAFLQGL